MQIQQRKISELIPYINNSRTHSDAQVSQIAASIKEFGFTSPILVDGENGIIAGHGRVMAAKKLGLDEVPTIELSHLSGPQRRAYIISERLPHRVASVEQNTVQIRVDVTKIERILEGVQKTLAEQNMAMARYQQEIKTMIRTAGVIGACLLGALELIPFVKSLM